MTKTIRVWAHWTDDSTLPLPVGHGQLPNAPVPYSLMGYPAPGGIVPSNHGWPTWNNHPGGRTNDPVILWCELARQEDIEKAGWYGKTQGVPPPAFLGQNDPSTHPEYGDEGYDNNGIGFKVSKITISLSLDPNSRQGLNREYQYDIYDPKGSLITSWIPDGQSNYTFSVLTPNEDRKGIWSIHIDRYQIPVVGAPQSTAMPPLLGGFTAPYANNVNEPYSFFNPYYGPSVIPPVFIGMEFEGEEIYNCPEVTITHEEADECVNGGRKVTLKASITAPASSPAAGQWVFSYDKGRTFVSGLNSSFYVAQGQTKDIQIEWDFPSGPNNTACLRFDQGANPGCNDVCSDIFQVTYCPVTCEVKLDYSPKPIPCGKPQTIKFVATFDPSYTGPYQWEVKDGSGTTVYTVRKTKSATLLNPNEFSYTFISFDTYQVIVTVDTPGCKNSDGTTPKSYASAASGDLVVGDCCGPKEHWDKEQKKCVPDKPDTNDCPDGYQWDEAQGKCVTICPDGYHWNNDKGQCEPDGEMSIGCWILLIIAFIAGIVGAILGIYGACTGAYLIAIIGAIVAVVSLILFIIWTVICAHNDCAVFNWVRIIIFYIMFIVAPIVALVIGIFGKDWVCAGIAELTLASQWGYVFAALEFLGPKIGCTLEDIPWPCDLLNRLGYNPAICKRLSSLWKLLMKLIGNSTSSS